MQADTSRQQHSMSQQTPLPQQGVLVPVVTPLQPDGTPDLDSLDRLLDFCISAGVHGLLVLGSSGEAVALSADERMAVGDRAVRHARGRAHVMLGVSAHGTKDATAEARRLDELWPDSLLVTSPAGFELSQAELSGHFRAVSAAVTSPMVAYEVPSRVGVSLDAELIRSLGADGVIKGVKDSSGDLVRGRAIAEATRDLVNFVRYTGCEQCIDGAMLAGYNGAIAGLANVFPEFHVELIRRAAGGDWVGASEIQGYLMQLFGLYYHPFGEASFSAQFFAVVKEALVQRGVIAWGTTSAPMTQADESVARHVAEFLRRGAELEHLMDGRSASSLPTG